MEITEDQIEWATVERMREMLVNVHDEYKVTHTYALCAGAMWRSSAQPALMPKPRDSWTLGDAIFRSLP